VIFKIVISVLKIKCPVLHYSAGGLCCVGVLLTFYDELTNYSTEGSIFISPNGTLLLSPSLFHNKKFNKNLWTHSGRCRNFCSRTLLEKHQNKFKKSLSILYVCFVEINLSLTRILASGHISTC
jgi:hypothetical protein